jgi:hypothetical protein
MPAANDIINPALKLLGVIAQGDTPATAESNDARAVLNAMIENWHLEDLNMIPRAVQVISLSAGTNSYALSPRPTRILAAQHIITAGVTDPVDVMDEQRFAAIDNYGLSGGRLKGVWYDGQQSSPTLHVAPAAGGTLRLYTVGTLPTFGDLVTNQTFPVGYDDALIYCLACKLGPMFGRVVSADLRRAADEAKAAIRSANAAPSMQTQPGGPVSAAQA